MKRIAIVIACAVLLACEAAAQQPVPQLQPQPVAPARNRVEVDLRSTAATGTVPFDVPFEITGSVPERVDRITLVYRECTGGDCPKTIERTPDCTPVIGSGWSEPRVWQRDALLVRAGEAARFTLPIDPLEAQRRYVFLFDVQGPPADDQVAAFRPRVRDVVARRFAAVTSSDNPQSFFKQLREDIVSDLRALTENCLVTDAFLQSTSDIAEFETRFAEIHDPQAQKGPAVERFNETVQTFKTELGDIAQSPLLALLPAAEQPAHADVIKLLSLPPLDREAVARGSSPVNPDRNLQSMSSTIAADAANARAAALQQTRALLLELSEWVQRSAPNVPADLQQKIRTAASHAFSLQTAAANIASRTTLHEQRVNAIAEAVREQLRTLRLIGSDTVGTFDTFSAWYVSADAGFAYAPQVESTLPYLGANVYFRPVNKDAPLRVKGGLKRRLSATVALSLASVGDNKTRKDLFNTQTLVLGGGYRLTDTLRIGGGTLIYKRIAADQSSSLAAAPYVSVSFDWNVAKQFAGLGKLFQ